MAVRAAIDDQTAGVFVEPIQGEGGVNVPTGEFMQGLRRLCDEKSMLLVVDEVWTAPARTGRWFAYQHYGITPDVMTLAKAIGGGLPLGACVAAPKWQDVLGPGKHACTHGRQPAVHRRGPGDDETHRGRGPRHPRRRQGRGGHGSASAVRGSAASRRSAARG